MTNLPISLRCADVVVSINTRMIYIISSAYHRHRDDDSGEAQTKNSQRHIDQHVVNKRDWCASLDPRFVRRDSRRVVRVTARSANTSNFTIARLVTKHMNCRPLYAYRGQPEIERHYFVATAYVIAERRFTKQSAALAEWLDDATARALLVGTGEAHHSIIVSGGRRSSAYTYALRATTGGSAVRSESDLLWRRLSARSCTARDGCMRETQCPYLSSI